MDTKEEEREKETVEREVLRVNLRKDSIEPVKDEVVVEDRMELYVNDEHYAVFSSSPSQIRALVLGHLLTEGIIDKPEEVAYLEISKGRARVYLTKKAKLVLSEKPTLILTECSSGSLKISPLLLMKVRRVKNAPSVRLNFQTILGAVEALILEHIFLGEPEGLMPQPYWTRVER